ncbi:MAG: membrane lipoprotein lipid attachment site-containing protein [Gemmatimonadales bacterium]
MRRESAEVAVKKLLLFAGAALVLAGCSEAPTAPTAAKRAPSVRPSNDITCRSGYVIAYDENGNPYCAADPNGQVAPTGQTAARPHS